MIARNTVQNTDIKSMHPDGSIAAPEQPVPNANIGTSYFDTEPEELIAARFTVAMALFDEQRTPEELNGVITSYIGVLQICRADLLWNSEANVSTIARFIEAEVEIVADTAAFAWCDGMYTVEDDDTVTPQALTSVPFEQFDPRLAVERPSSRSIGDDAWVLLQSDRAQELRSDGIRPHAEVALLGLMKALTKICKVEEVGMPKAILRLCAI